MTEKEMERQEKINKRRADQRMKNMKGAWKRKQERNRIHAGGPQPTEKELLQSEDD